MLAQVGYWRRHVGLALSLPQRSCMGLSQFISSLNLVFYSQLYLIVGFRCKNCIILYMLPILVLLKLLLHCSSMCGSFSQLNRLGNLQLVVYLANVVRMIISCSKDFYSPYVYLHKNLNNIPWVSLQIFLQFMVRMVCLFVLTSLVSSVHSSIFLCGRESLVLSRYHNCCF